MLCEGRALHSDKYDDEIKAQCYLGDWSERDGGKEGECVWLF